MALPLSQTWRISGQSTTAVIACYILHNIYLDIRDDVDVGPEHDEPDELLPLLGHVNSEEGSRLRNKIKEAFFQ